ncbi:metallophosphoesterase family protein [Parapedobacter indicus]|uniref:Calcineurin-like phosphoesterase n=1 Tax=Parapedobacter indicus TaxID=1477437 RepID=A0A1I3TTH8_9SPHI|nr:metallophosphoesterase [Parapedobacter indicus]PPK99418.1 calcineurin-like phosphoesterase family protein [Parapedobacter indicus]SFJ74584.1 Calcineurin-like phosphoesterase [Parapedobacter indicus]
MTLKRRTFLKSAGFGVIGAALPEHIIAGPRPFEAKEGSVSLTGNHVQWHLPQLKQPVNVFFISDTHLWQSDERELPFTRYSGRMAKAYNRTHHFQTGAETSPQEAFVSTLALAREQKADMLLLGGDIFSYPSEAAIEWAAQQLSKAAIPYVYTTGNHDWHYEGMPGPLHTLRDTWINKRLLPLYQGNNPLMHTVDVQGIRFVVLDNSTYEILPEQLDFFRKSLQTDLPIVLAMHIPLYAPGRSVGFGCGHPEWKAENDRNFELERRERWPAGGHTATTLNFHREVFAASNIIGVIAGHIHTTSVDMWNGVPQVVAPANALGGYLSLEFVCL